MGNATRPGSRAPRALPELLVALALSVLTAAPYARVFALGFVYDDRSFILQNAVVLRGLSREGVGWAFSSFYHANWQPLTWISAMLDAELFGARPAGFHGTNLLLHLANVLLLWRVLRRLAGAPWRSAAVAALFAVHPLNVETVAWITERSNLLGLLFGLLALRSWSSHAAAPGPGRLLAAAGWYAASLLAKPMLVTLPFLLLLLDVWPLGRAGWPHAVAPHGRTPGALRARAALLLAEKAPLLLLAGASAAVTIAAQRSYGAIQSSELFPLSGRLANAATAYAGYLVKVVWPADLAAFYPYRGDRIPAAEILGACALLAALGAVAAASVCRRPHLVLGWLWFLGLLVPVIGLVQVGAQAMADRYLYPSAIGIFLACAWLAADFAGRRPGRRLALAAAAGCALVLLAAATARQTGFWRDEIALYSHALAVTTANDVAHHNLGVTLLERGEVAAAARHFREALRVNPFYPDARAGLADTLVRTGRVAEGIREYREALRLRPEFPVARVNLGAALAGAGEWAEAEGHYREAIRLNPGLAVAHMNLGNLLADAGRPGDALAEYAAALRIAPGDPQIHYNRGVTLEAIGRRAEAAAAYREALRLRPDFAAAAVRLSRLPPARR